MLRLHDILSFVWTLRIKKAIITVMTGIMVSFNYNQFHKAAVARKPNTETYWFWKVKDSFKNRKGISLKKNLQTRKYEWRSLTFNKGIKWITVHSVKPINNPECSIKWKMLSPLYTGRNLNIHKHPRWATAHCSNLKSIHSFGNL